MTRHLYDEIKCLDPETYDAVTSIDRQLADHATNGMILLRTRLALLQEFEKSRSDKITAVARLDIEAGR